jgi:hypothetical protein
MLLSFRTLVRSFIVLVIVALFATINTQAQSPNFELISTRNCIDADIKLQFGGFANEGGVYFNLLNPKWYDLTIKGARFYFPDHDHPAIAGEPAEGYRLTKVIFGGDTLNQPGSTLLWMGDVGNGNTSTNSTTYNNPTYIGNTLGQGESVGTWIQDGHGNLDLVRIWLDFDDISGSLFDYGARPWHFDKAKIYLDCQPSPTVTPRPSQQPFSCSDITLLFSSPSFEDNRFHMIIENNSSYMIALTSVQFSWRQLEPPYAQMYLRTMGMSNDLHWTGTSEDSVLQQTTPPSVRVDTGQLTEGYRWVWAQGNEFWEAVFFEGPSELNPFLSLYDIAATFTFNSETLEKCTITIGEDRYPTTTPLPQYTATATTDLTLTETPTATSVSQTPTEEMQTATPTYTPTFTATIETPSPTLTPAIHDLLINGGFEDDSGWEGKNLSKDKIVCNKPDKTLAFEGNCAFMFKGGTNEKARLRQAVSIEGLGFSANETVMLSAYVNARGSAANGKIQLIVEYGETTLQKTKITLKIAPNEGYTLLSSYRTLLSADVEKIMVQIVHSSTSGKVYVDGMRLDWTDVGEMLALPH